MKKRQTFNCCAETAHTVVRTTYAREAHATGHCRLIPSPYHPPVTACRLSLLLYSYCLASCEFTHVTWVPATEKQGFHSQ